MAADQIEVIKQFVKICKENTDILHKPEMSFFREFGEGLGAKIPPKESAQFEAEAELQEETKEKSEPEPEPEIPKPELDNEGIIKDKTGAENFPMGDESKEVTDADVEKATEFRDTAYAALSEGNYEKATEYFTKSIELNPGSAVLHAKRASALIKMSKLTAAIRDCNKAIEINPDSAAGYKFRGRAHRLLGHWITAHNDLATACKLDYDDVAYEWLKEVEPNAKKLLDYDRAVERQAEERKLRERAERSKRAQEAHKHAAAGEGCCNSGEQSDEPGMGGGMGAFADLFKDDPELVQGLKNDPTIMTKLLECMQNPANMMKYMDNPIIKKLMTKLMGGMGGGGGGFPFSAGAAGGAEPMFEDEPKQPKKAPEPDLD